MLYVFEWVFENFFILPVNQTADGFDFSSWGRIIRDGVWTWSDSWQGCRVRNNDIWHLFLTLRAGTPNSLAFKADQWDIIDCTVGSLILKLITVSLPVWPNIALKEELLACSTSADQSISWNKSWHCVAVISWSPHLMFAIVHAAVTGTLIGSWGTIVCQTCLEGTIRCREITLHIYTQGRDSSVSIKLSSVRFSACHSKLDWFVPSLSQSVYMGSLEHLIRNPSVLRDCDILRYGCSYVIQYVWRYVPWPCELYGCFTALVGNGNVLAVIKALFVYACLLLNALLAQVWFILHTTVHHLYSCCSQHLLLNHWAINWLNTKTSWLWIDCMHFHNLSWIEVRLSAAVWDALQRHILISVQYSWAVFVSANYDCVCSLVQLSLFCSFFLAASQELTRVSVHVHGCEEFGSWRNYFWRTSLFLVCPSLFWSSLRMDLVPL